MNQICQNCAYWDRHKKLYKEDPDTGLCDWNGLKESHESCSFWEEAINE